MEWLAASPRLVTPGQCAHHDRTAAVGLHDRLWEQTRAGGEQGGPAQWRVRRVTCRHAATSAAHRSRRQGRWPQAPGFSALEAHTSACLPCGASRREASARRRVVGGTTRHLTRGQCPPAWWPLGLCRAAQSSGALRGRGRGGRAGARRWGASAQAAAAGQPGPGLFATPDSDPTAPPKPDSHAPWWSSRRRWARRLLYICLVGPRGHAKGLVCDRRCQRGSCSREGTAVV